MREVTRLPDQLQLQWRCLNGLTLDQWRRLPNPSERRSKVETAITVMFVDPDETNFEKYKPANTGQGEWYLFAIGGGAARFNTSTGELDPGDIAITQDEVIWKTLNGDYERYTANDVTIARDGRGEVSTVEVKPEARRR